MEKVNSREGEYKVEINKLKQKEQLLQTKYKERADNEIQKYLYIIFRMKAHFSNEKQILNEEVFKLENYKATLQVKYLYLF